MIGTGWATYLFKYETELWAFLFSVVRWAHEQRTSFILPAPLLVEFSTQFVFILQQFINSTRS
jgi:hypothetical protein